MATNYSNKFPLRVLDKLIGTYDSHHEGGIDTLQLSFVELNDLGKKFMGEHAKLFPASCAVIKWEEGIIEVYPDGDVTDEDPIVEVKPNWSLLFNSN